jgi:pimeloyl-ACP methyl ester carboxylesterase
VRLLRGGEAYGSAASEEAKARDREVLAHDPYTRRGVAAQALALSNYNLEKTDAAAMHMPTLVIHGDEDKTVPLAYGEECAAILPNARFLSLQGAGHNYFVARAAEANAAVLEFVDEVDAKG